MIIWRVFDWLIKDWQQYGNVTLGHCRLPNAFFGKMGDPSFVRSSCELGGESIFQSASATDEPAESILEQCHWAEMKCMDDIINKEWIKVANPL